VAYCLIDQKPLGNPGLAMTIERAGSASPGSIEKVSMPFASWHRASVREEELWMEVRRV